VLQHARDYLNDLLLDNPGDCPYELKHPNEYRLKIVGLSYYLMKENVPLHRVQIIQVCNKTFVTPRLELIEIKSDSLDEAQHTLVEKRLAAEVLLDKQVNMLIGFQHLAKFLSYENDEILHFRRKLTKARLKFLEQRKQVNADKSVENDKEEMLPQYKLSESMPVDVKDSAIVICHLPDNNNKGESLSPTAFFPSLPASMAVVVDVCLCILICASVQQCVDVRTCWHTSRCCCCCCCCLLLLQCQPTIYIACLRKLLPGEWARSSVVSLITTPSFFFRSQCKSARQAVRAGVQAAGHDLSAFRPRVQGPCREQD
jgi:PI3-kinase family, ras-binding domain